MKKRILSAIVLTAILVPLVVAGGKPFLITIGVLAIISLKEIIDLPKSHSKIPNGIVLLAMITLLLLIFYEYEITAPFGGPSTMTLALMSLTFLLPTMLQYKKGEYETKDAFYLIGVLLFLSTAFHSVIVLRAENINLLVYLLLIAICTDIFAYFIGSFFGKRKIFPNISPNKTYAGCIGGAILGTIIPVLFYYFVISKEQIVGILIITFLLTIVTELGDLLFSKIKRENGIKDFSDLIPGHGGILDRFDSFIFVALAYMILIRFI